jgi:protein-L-isoaspartate(D-aspartate) O-methyltransferase
VADIALQRKNMVESQVRPSDVTDRRITSAMQDVPREKFVPAELTDVAYMDDPLTAAPGRSLLAPRAFARLLQLADVQTGDKVLIVGALLGYSAAVVARLAGKVVALESDAALAAGAKSTLAAAGVANAYVVTGPLAEGYPADAPYDVIIVEGGIEIVPDALVAQLAPGAKMVAIETGVGIGRAVLMQKITSGGTDEATIARRVAFETAATCLPGFARAKTFSF